MTNKKALQVGHGLILSILVTAVPVLPPLHPRNAMSGRSIVPCPVYSTMIDLREIIELMKQVLAQIERKLMGKFPRHLSVGVGQVTERPGYNGTSDQPLPVKKQVQELIEEAVDLRNLSQGESIILSAQRLTS